MTDLGSLYILIEETRMIFDYSVAFQIAFFIAIIGTLELYIYRTLKEKKRLAITMSLLLISSLLVVLNVDILYNSQESMFYEEFKATEYYDANVDASTINIYADIESNRINVVQVDEHYYYISGGNWSILDSEFFENKIAPSPYI